MSFAFNAAALDFSAAPLLAIFARSSVPSGPVLAFAAASAAFLPFPKRGITLPNFVALPALPTKLAPLLTPLAIAPPGTGANSVIN